MLVIHNVNKINGYKYSDLFKIKYAEVRNEKYSFWLEYNGEMHEFPIELSRHPNFDGSYELSYKNRYMLVSKNTIMDIDILVEKFRQL